MKRILTIDALVKYCVENKLYEFNSKDTDTQLVVRVPACFSETTFDEDDGFLRVTLRACHIGLNRNGSYISEDNMKKALPSLKYRPILASIHELDNGELEFHGHDMEIDDEGNIKYIEKQVGTFTADDPWLEYNEEYDKTYVMANALIPIEYTEAADIIKKHNGSKVSVELVIDTLSYNAKEKYLELIDFRFNGCTLLGYQKDGTEIGEGMLGSRLDISDFSVSKDYFSKLQDDNEFKQMVAELTANYLLNNNTQKGGISMSKLEELMSKYQVTVEDIKFETDNLSDEELEAVFKEAFEDVDDTTATDNTNDVDPGSITDTFDNEGEGIAVSNIKKYSVEFDGKTYEYELSLNDTIVALEKLVNDTYYEEDDVYYGVIVYDEYVVMRSYWNGKAYRQGYELVEDSYSLVGERVEVYANYLTKEEEEEIKNIRSKYSELVEYKANIEEKELRDQKANIVENSKYDNIREVEAFKELVKNIDKYSIEEIEVKAKVILADNIELVNFSFNDNSQKSRVGIGYETNGEEKPYGDLW